MKLADIEGSSPKKPYMRNTSYDAFNYTDITKNKFISSRVTNPLQPVYKARDDAGNLIDMGPIRGSVPAKMPERQDAEKHSFLKIPQGVEGGVADTKGIGSFTFYKRKDEAKKLTNTQDVPGA